MSRYWLKRVFLCALVSFVGIANAFTPVEGKAYQRLTHDKIPAQATAVQSDEAGKVNVTEFFSYGCPACARFEPTLEAWLKQKPAYVHFTRIPVTFEEGWMPLAAAYYTAKRLNIAEKISPKIFHALWQEHQDLSSQASLQAFFVKHGGVSAEQFKETYEFAPQMAAQVFNGQALMNTYKIDEIPTLVIQGKFKTSVAMSGSPENTIATLNYLIAKEAKHTGK